MTVFHCPHCELSFRFANELTDHLTIDHPDFSSEQKTIEDSLLAAAHRPRRRTPRSPAPVQQQTGEASVVEPRPTVEVTHQGGDRFAVQIGSHRLAVDQPVSGGGDGSAPTPTELFVASLASCVAFYGRRFLRRHRLPESICVRAEWTLDSKPARVTDIRIGVSAPGLPAGLTERFEKVIDHCTVHNTLRTTPVVAIRLLTGEDTEAAG